MPNGPAVGVPGAAVQPRVFICYSRTDAALARRVVEALAEHRVEARIDTSDVVPSPEWWSKVQASIESSDAVVFLLSPAALASPVCRDELAHARLHHKRVLPVLAETLEPGARAALPSDTLGAALARLHWIAARPEDDFALAMNQLADAVRDDLVWVRASGGLLQRAIAWDRRGRRSGLLLRERALRDARVLIERSGGKEPPPTVLQTEYVAASLQRTGRRSRRVWSGFGLLALALLVGGAAAAWQTASRSLERDEAASRQLAALAPIAQEDDEPARALLLAVAAQQRGPTPESAHALLEGLDRLRGLQRLPEGVFNPFGPLALSPDGRRAAAIVCEDRSPQACARPQLVVLDTASGRPIATRSGPQPADALAFSPDGRQLAIASCCDDGPVTGVDGQPMDAGAHAVVRLYDLPETPGEGAGGGAAPQALQTPVRSFAAPGGPLAELSFDGPGRLLGRNEHLLRWQASSGRLERAEAHSANLADGRHRWMLESRGAESEPPRDSLALFRLAAPGAAPAPAASTPSADPAAAPAAGAEAASGAAGDPLDGPPPTEAAHAHADAHRPDAEFDLGIGLYSQAAFAPGASRAAAISCLGGGSGEHCVGELRLFDLDAGRPIGATQTDTRSLNPMLSLAFLNDRWLATGGCGASTPSSSCTQGLLRIWSVRDSGLRPTAHDIPVPGGEVLKLAASANGERLASIGATGQLALWSTAPGTLERTGALPSPLQASRTDLDEAPLLRCENANVYHPLLQPATLALHDPQTACDLIAGLDDGWPQAAAWDVKTGRLAVGGCREVSENGACIAGVVTRFDRHDGKFERGASTPLAAGVTALAWQPGSEAIAIASCLRIDAPGCALGASVELAPAVGQPPRMLATALGAVGALAFTPDGRRIAYASCVTLPPEGSPISACARTGLRTLTPDVEAETGPLLDGPRTGVRALAFDASGHRLFVGDNDGDLSLIDIDAGRRLGPTLDLHFEPIEALTLETDGQLLATTASSRSRWHADVQAWNRRACALAGRSSTEIERQRWLGPGPAGAVCSAAGEALAPPPPADWLQALRDWVERSRPWFDRLLQRTG